MCRFSEANGKMIHNKPEAKHHRTQECTDVTSQNFRKILSFETIPLKSRVNGFLKRNIQKLIFQCRVLHKINYLSSLFKGSW